MTHKHKVGSLEKKALKHLAIRPKQHAQAVQRNLGIPDRNYGAVLNSLKRLHNKGLVKFDKGVSDKNIPTKLYLLTDDGVNYVLRNAVFSTKELDKVIENYSEGPKTQQILKEMHRKLGTELTTKLFSTYAGMGMLKDKGLTGQAHMMLISTFVSGLTKKDAKNLDAFIDNFTLKNPRIKKKVKAYLKKRHLL